MIGDEKVNLGPFATLFGHGFGFFDDRKAWGRVLTLPLDQPGDFPRTLAAWAGVPKVARIGAMARRTCWGVAGRVRLSQGRRLSWTSARASTSWLSTAATSQVQRSNCSGVRKRGRFHNKACLQKR